MINGAEIQSVVRPAGNKFQKRPHVLKKNPLKNKQVLLRLNPYAKAFAQQKLGQQKVEKTSSKTSSEFKNLLHEA
jgi:large subunit ribosomal protein L4e